MTTEDREEIRDLLAKYCHYVDAADTENWLNLYTDEGSLDLGMGGEPLVGKEALREMSSRRRPGAGLHVSANAVIEVDGDRASVESYLLLVGADPQAGPSAAYALRLAGQYSDELRKVGGSWKFVSRTLKPLPRATS